MVARDGDLDETQKGRENIGFFSRKTKTLGRSWSSACLKQITLSCKIRTVRGLM